MSITKNIFSVDAETEGLWGKIFAIAAIVYDTEGKEIEHFIFRCSAEIKNEWVRENVLPAINDIPVSGNYNEMMTAFADFYKKHKDNADVLWHMGHIVEAELFRELYRNSLIGEWDAPYTPIELASVLEIFGEDPDSVDKYAQKEHLKIKEYGTTHNPLYDCEVAAKAYFHLILKISEPWNRIKLR